MIDKEFAKMLSCPLDSSVALRLIDIVEENDRIISGNLQCTHCDREYTIANGIPDLFPGEEVRTVVGESEFEKWSSALDVFIEWRKKTWTDPLLKDIARKSTDKLKKNFFEFAQIEPGMLLDIGGAGGYSRNFLPEGTIYHGLDPLPIPEDVKEFRFARGVGEFIPFMDSVFDSVQVLESMDHFISPARFIDEAARVLKPGGKLYISQDIDEHEPKRTTGQKIKNLAGYILKGDFKSITEKAKMEIAGRRKVNPEKSHTQHFTEESILKLSAKKFDVVATLKYGSSFFLHQCKNQP